MLREEPSELSSSIKSTADLATAAAEHVYRDLEKYIGESTDERRRLKHMAKRTDIHEKTLGRLAKRENKPTYITIFKIYRFLLNETDDGKILELVPPAVSEYLKRASAQTLRASTTYSSGLEMEMRENPVLAELLILCATGPLKRSYVRSRFGDFGLQVVATGLKRNVFEAMAGGEICRGSTQVNMAPETVTAVAIQMMQSHLKPENAYVTGENFLGFYAAGLSDDAYQKWLAIDAEAFQKKIAVAKKPESRGDIRAFTTQAVDHAEIERRNLGLPKSTTRHRSAALDKEDLP